MRWSRWIPQLYWRGAPAWARLVQVAAIVTIAGVFFAGRDLDPNLRRALAVLALAGWVYVQWRKPRSRGDGES
ncbi:MAG: hypothetical protein V3S18_05365 [Dehalococcoidia bacterium]